METGVPPEDVNAELLIRNCDGGLMNHNGWTWVAHHDLLDAGYRGLQDSDVVQVHGRFFELQAHVGKTAENLPGGAWWIVEIEPRDFNAWLANITADDFANYIDPFDYGPYLPKENPA